MLEKRLRLWSGVIVMLYVIPHLLNHSLGLISLNAMESMRLVMASIWRDPPGAIIFLGAFVLHFFLSLFSLYRRNTLRMPIWEGAQISLGILIFPLLLGHIIGTQGVAKVIGFMPTYEYVIAAIWVSDPIRGVQQTFVMFVVWGHMCMGLHFWLRLKRWYRKWLPFYYGLAILIPVTAFLGFARVGRELAIASEQTPGYLARIFKPITQADPNLVATLQSLEPNIFLFFGFVVVTVFLARIVRRVYRNRHGVYNLSLPNGKVLTAPIGQTILETLRVSGIPHASVCGGRGRCTTCRVHVGEAVNHLPKPLEVEQRALDKINAEPKVRLACQTRPEQTLSIRPMLSPSATAGDANRAGGIQGREQEVAVMFVDLRGSTKIGEDKLPYDVLFVLNQFFAEMAGALEETGGHYAQFTGDGLMGLYGIDGNIKKGCRNAINGAANMKQRLDNLNASLARELKEPLRMGVGIHAGDAIVGTMGPPESQNFSAIGDEVNIAARLEAQSKEYDCFLVISQAALEIANVDASAHPVHLAELKGRIGKIEVFAVDDPRELVVPA